MLYQLQGLFWLGLPGSSVKSRWFHLHLLAERREAQQSKVTFPAHKGLIWNSHPDLSTTQSLVLLIWNQIEVWFWQFFSLSGLCSLSLAIFVPIRAPWFCPISVLFLSAMHPIFFLFTNWLEEIGLLSPSQVFCLRYYRYGCSQVALSPWLKLAHLENEDNNSAYSMWLLEERRDNANKASLSRNWGFMIRCFMKPKGRNELGTSRPHRTKAVFSISLVLSIQVCCLLFLFSDQRMVTGSFQAHMITSTSKRGSVLLHNSQRRNSISWASSLGPISLGQEGGICTDEASKSLSTCIAWSGDSGQLIG